jgi:hypothetical protein
MCRVSLRLERRTSKPKVLTSSQRGIMFPRQARLRELFSSCYPDITPDKWHHALWTREMALSQLRRGGPQWQSEGRVLSDEHFDFHGGFSERGTRREVRRELPPNLATAGDSD